MIDKRLRHKGRRGIRRPTFTLLPHDLQHCENWAHATKPCRALVADLASQYNGYNNGAICGSRTALRRQGWNSPGSLRDLLIEACYYGFIVQTHQGGLGIGPNRYALGWQKIDDCNGQLDDPSLVGTTPGRWKIPREKYQKPSAAKNKTPVRREYRAGTDYVPGKAATGT